jgi:hypothetical protein
MMGWLVTLWLLGTLVAGTAQAQGNAVPSGPSRVDFDDRLVKGQRRGTGSVYIFERQKVELRSMVKKPHSFRRRIVVTVFEE